MLIDFAIILEHLFIVLIWKTWILSEEYMNQYVDLRLYCNISEHSIWSCNVCSCCCPYDDLRREKTRSAAASHRLHASHPLLMLLTLNMMLIYALLESKLFPAGIAEQLVGRHCQFLSRKLFNALICRYCFWFSCTLWRLFAPAIMGKVLGYLALSR